jgi:hypothetical protein
MVNREDFKFVATDGANGKFWIRADQTPGEGVAVPALLGFELASNTTRQEAFEVAEYMNKHINGVYYEDFSSMSVSDPSPKGGDTTMR